MEEKKAEEKKDSALRKVTPKEITARVAFYLAFVSLAIGLYVKFFNPDLGTAISPGAYVDIAVVWLLASIAVILWNISENTKPR